MEKRIDEKVPGVTVVPGLSVRVKGMKGPIAGGELPRCKEFGEKVVPGNKYELTQYAVLVGSIYILFFFFMIHCYNRYSSFSFCTISSLFSSV